MAPTINFQVDPVEPDKYNDVNGLSDPFNMNILVGVSNTHTATLYFQASLDSPPGDYTASTTNFGALTSGSSAVFTHILTRAMPTLTDDEYDESLDFVISAYTDAGYSDLYATQTLSVDVHHFDHAGATWNIVEHVDFTSSLNGWTLYGGELSTTHFYSSPSSAKINVYSTGPNYYSGYLQKTVNTGAADRARIILHIYDDGHAVERAEVSVGGVVKKPRTLSTPINKWIRLAFNHPVNTNTLDKITCYYLTEYDYHYFWVDEIWVISK